MLVALYALLTFQIEATIADVDPFTRALWLLHVHGKIDCSQPKSDRQVKGVLAKALANDRQLVLNELGNWISPESFNKIAGEDHIITESEITDALSSSLPVSRALLTPSLQRHAELLSTSFEMIEPAHYQSIDRLSSWIAENCRNDQPLAVITTCTGNSRRSILSAMMGNLAAAYCGLDNVRFYSGGTKPSAFNQRTIATLQQIGFSVEPTGAEADRGEPQTANPIYRVSWGQGLEAVEFSKRYNDNFNPQKNFAAVMVCSDADAECPTVAGAALRVSMMFDDPKVYDGGRLEPIKYAERRDDIGRTFLAIMTLARRKIADRKD